VVAGATQRGDGHAAPDFLSGAALSSQRFRAVTLSLSKGCARSLTRPDTALRRSRDMVTVGGTAAVFAGLRDLNVTPTCCHVRVSSVLMSS